MPLVFSEEVHELMLPEPALDLDFSNDGSLLAVAVTGYKRCPSIQVYRTEDASLVGEFGVQAIQGRGVAFTEDGRQLYFLVQNEEGNYELYRVTLNNGVPEQLAPYGIGERCYSLIRDSSGSLIAVLGNCVEVWDTERNEVVRHIKGISEDGRVLAAFPSNSPHLYIYGTAEGSIVLFDIAENTEINRWAAPKPFGQQVVVSPSEEFLVAVGWGTEGVFVYNTNTNERFQPERYNESSLTRLFTFSWDSSLLISRSGGGAEGKSLSTGKRIKGSGLNRSRQVAIATAWEAPIIAYAQEDNSLFWLRLVEKPDLGQE